MSRTGHSVQLGAGLIDTLVALTLLAFSLLGASTTLIKTLTANRAAELQTTAVDLATDLAEDRRAGSVLLDEADLVQLWRRRVAAELPGANPLDQTLTASDVTVRWRDPVVQRSTDFALETVGSWPGAAR
jgi:Tfp pilus assembly protein PilV